MIFSLCWKNLQTNGAGEGTRTHTLADRNLNPTRLPIPPRPHIYQLVGLPLPTFFSSYVLILSVSWNTVDFLIAPAYIWLPEKRYAETSGQGYPYNNKRLTAGCPGGARTHDIQINSLALYRLSYRAI